MIPTVMIPLDGSPDAEQALPWAMSLASHTSGTVRVVGVHAPPAIYLDGQTLVGSVTPDDEVRAQEEEYLDGVEQRVRTASGVSISADLVDGGVLEALLQHVKIIHPKWIVMVSHGRGAVARFFLGNTATDFVRESPVPVLLLSVKDHEPPDLAKHPIIKRILIPLDGSVVAEQILEPAMEFGKLYAAEFQVMMTLDAVPDIESIAMMHEPGLPGPWDETAVRAKADRYLEHMADRLRAKGFTAHAHIVPHGQASERIIETANTQPHTVIALATHGRGGLAKLVWGSVTEQVVRHTNVPVLIYKPTNVQ